MNEPHDLTLLSDSELTERQAWLRRRIDQIGSPVTKAFAPHLPIETINQINVVMTSDRKRYNELLCAIEAEITRRT